MDTIASFIYNLPPKTSTLVAVLLGFVLIDDLPANKQNILGSFLALVGQVISTNATNQDYVDSLESDEEKEQMKKDIEKLQRQISELNKRQ